MNRNPNAWQRLCYLLGIEKIEINKLNKLLCDMLCAIRTQMNNFNGSTVNGIHNFAWEVEESPQRKYQNGMQLINHKYLGNKLKYRATCQKLINYRTRWRVMTSLPLTSPSLQAVGSPGFSPHCLQNLDFASVPRPFRPGTEAATSRVEVLSQLPPALSPFSPSSEP